MKVENVSGMKLGKRENPENKKKIPTLPTTIVLLATARLELEAHRWVMSCHSYTRTAYYVRVPLKVIAVLPAFTVKHCSRFVLFSPRFL